MRTKKFNKYEKRAIFSNRLTHFEEIIDDSTVYPYHKEKKLEDGYLVNPTWEYEYFRYGITESEKFHCYAKRSSERKQVEEHGLRSDYTISVSRFKQDEILKIPTKDIYLYPKEKEVDTGFFYIKIIDAKIFIKENTFWWNYEFEFVGNSLEA
ncbi:hypothetical protein [Chryseobacterium sp. FH1]|uniref:hypothetical protein n=1 Tax=Chryseobacterium sp. FH1 TaxID=1233951 RepID=UPI0004E2D75C|nr:hypothetical protein [Chryseobacterium sp. FH1]KFC19341.1 hypothetical protein IO90_08515 [Chryseobacterium sp. FH1]